MFSLKNHCKNNVIFKLFGTLGDYAFGIYLCHCYFIDFILSKFALTNWTLRAIITPSLYLILIYPIRKYTPKISKKYFGI